MATAEIHPEPQPARHLHPVRSTDRILSLDVIRGFAVLGILAVNAITFGMPWEVMANPTLQPGGFEGEAVTAWQAMYVFFQDKMRTLFSMLFGASIFLIGGERSDKARGKLLRRRLFWLAVFGLLHGLAFWFGDILLLYAWAGLFVLLARSWSARRLLIIGVLVNVIGAALYVGLMMSLNMAPPEALQEAMVSSGWQPDASALAAQIEAMRGDAWSVTLTQMEKWVTVVPIMLIAMLPATIALMFIGMGLYKVGFLTGRAPTWVYGLFTALGAGAVYLIWQESAAVIAAGFPFVETMSRPANTFLAPLVSVGYASLLVLMTRFGLKLILTPLARAGQMAFTNYLTQTLIMTTIFYGGRGLGWYGEFGWPEMWLFIGGVWLLQLIWSPLWLSRFELGPIEWVWRSLTYGRPVRLTRVRD